MKMFAFGTETGWRLALAACASSLLVAMSFIWSPSPADHSPAIARAGAHLVPGSLLPAMNRSAAAEAILRRPLFSLNRRPPAAPRGRVFGSADGTPRLTGTLIFPGTRRALFSDGQTTFARQEGQKIGDREVISIADGGVLLRSHGLVVHVAVAGAGSAMPQAAALAPGLENGGAVPPGIAERQPEGQHEE